MKTKLSILLTAIAGGVVSAMPAQAFSFGTGGISFDEDTTLEFEVLQTYGRYRTDLRLYEVVDGEIFADLGILFGEVQAADNMVWDPVDQRYEPTNDPLGTAGNAVVGSPTTFTFEAGKEYSLGIVNYHFSQPNGLDPQYARSTFYSTTALNEDGMQRAVFGSTGGIETGGFNAFMYADGNPFGSYLNISFDDGGNNDDKDYQDFTFRAKVLEMESTPEPATLAGLGIVAGGMFLSRSRKKQK